ncbi:MAG TPA: DUF4405 domain-containing protein [Phycisphaerae bacterium]|nr:DUF4405 domain-containing protein [Phycisphaerae bacterium]
MAAAKRKFFSLRGFTSFAVTLFFLVLIASGAVLYAAPRGRDANWSGWQVMNLLRTEWVALHVLTGCAFVVFGTIHLVLNWRPLWHYVHVKAEARIPLWKELLLAVVLIAVLSAGAILRFPPMATVMAWNDQIKDAWTAALSDAPRDLAEEASLEDLAARAGVLSETLVAALRQRGYSIGSPQDSLSRVAEANHTTAAAIFRELQKDYPQLGGGKGRGRQFGKGRRQP